MVFIHTPVVATENEYILFERVRMYVGRLRLRYATSEGYVYAIVGVGCHAYAVNVITYNQLHLSA